MFLGLVKKINQGYMGIIMTKKGIAFLCLPQKTEKEAREKIRTHLQNQTVHFTSFNNTTEKIWESLERYFDGKQKTFGFSLDLDSGTDFEKKVWKYTQTIPYGETRSYGWIADKCSRRFAYRAVGNALGKNPVPILIPCHRVIRSDGGLGGFGSGIQWKRQLLELEQVGKRK